MPRIICVTLTVFNFAAGNEVQIRPEPEMIVLSCDFESQGFTHSRVERSADLRSWETVASLGLIDGQGECRIPEVVASHHSAFFKIVEDDSSENVLELPSIPYDYSTIIWPDHLAGEEAFDNDNTPDANPVTNEGALLGRVLFYDKKLSANYSLSCASCHQQEHGFSDPDQFSIGFEGGLTGRNSMGLTNSQFYASGHFFWDERADTLEDQVLEPIQNEVEMGLTLEEAVERISEYEYYADLFEGAFGDSEVTSLRISQALAQFVRSIVSHDTRYDEGEVSEFQNFTNEERLGHQLFHGRARCANCHEGPNFVGSRVENNGLEYPFVDLGVGDVTGRTRDEGKFKMSSLRNVEVTGPYMHDGRFDTLEEVVEHYNSGVVDNPNLGRSLRDDDGNPLRLNLSEVEKSAIVAFLLTLTDNTTLTDPKWSDPFAEGAQ